MAAACATMMLSDGSEVQVTIRRLHRRRDERMLAQRNSKVRVEIVTQAYRFYGNPLSAAKVLEFEQNHGTSIWRLASLEIFSTNPEMKPYRYMRVQAGEHSFFQSLRHPASNWA